MSKNPWRLSVDFVSQVLYVTWLDGESDTFPLYSIETFRLISQIWLKTGWANRYSYNFSWMGRPIIQLPEDVIAIQDVIHRVRPDTLIETGVAHGGSSVFYASLFESYGHGRVISIDREIRPHNRKALEEHSLKKRITLVEGDSISENTVKLVRGLLNPDDIVMLALDSNHSRAHVLRELELYGPLVTKGSYVVVADGIMKDLYDVPNAKPEWAHDNPVTAVHDFLASHPEFEIDPEPTRLGVTYYPRGFLRRK